MLIAFLRLQNGINSSHKRFNYIINVYFKFSIKLTRFIMISMIKLKIFQVNLMSESLCV